MTGRSRFESLCWPLVGDITYYTAYGGSISACFLSLWKGARLPVVRYVYTRPKMQWDAPSLLYHSQIRAPVDGLIHYCDGASSPPSPPPYRWLRMNAHVVALGTEVTTASRETASGRQFFKQKAHASHQFMMGGDIYICE